MNSKISLSIFAILGTLAIAGGATYAFFSDTNSSTGNVFSSGNLDLRLDDANEAFTSGTVSASVGGAGLAPGGSVTGFISLHNNGSIAMAEVELGANKTADDGDGNFLEDVLNLTVKTGTNFTCTTGDSDHTAAIAAILGDGFMPLTLTELIASDYDALPGLASNADYFACITTTMQSTALNVYQSNTVTVDYVFTGNQDASL